MAGAGLVAQPSWMVAPHALCRRAGSSQLDGPRFLGQLRTQENLALLPVLDCPSLGRSAFNPQVFSRSQKIYYIRSEASRHRERFEEPRQQKGGSFGSSGRPLTPPIRQGLRAGGRVQALAGPLLKRLRGQRRHVTEGDADLQLKELLEDLNRRIGDLNRQLQSSEPADGPVPLLKSVSVPPLIKLKAPESQSGQDLKGRESSLPESEEEWTGPSALTTLLVDYSMMVASVWAMQGTIKQAFEQQVPAAAMNAVNSISQPALNAVKSVAPPVVKYIGEPALVAARYTGIPQGIGRVSDIIRSTPDLRERMGASNRRRRLSSIPAASRQDSQLAGEDETDPVDQSGVGQSENGQSASGGPSVPGKSDANNSWWKGTLGSWEPLGWWSSGEGDRGEEEKAAEALQDPAIWPRLSAAVQEASTSRGEGDEGKPGELEEAGMAAVGEGILGAEIAGAKEQVSEAPGWDGGRKGEDPQQPLGFSFSAAGLLFPYHLGVCEKLMEAGLFTDMTPLAGSSAGAIVSAALGAGVTPIEALQMTKDLAKDCRKNGTAGRLGSVLRGILQRVLPENCHEMCNGRVRVAVTQLFRWPKGVLVDEFYSKEDVIEALITSSFIPGYLAPAAANVFRDRYCIDGGMTLFMPPTSGKETIRVCAFPASAYGLQNVQISPDCNPDGRASLRQLLSWALEPPSDGILDDLFLQGQADASVWISNRTAPDKGTELQLAEV